MDTVCTGPTSGRRWKRIACPDSWYAVIFFSFSDIILLFFSTPIPTLTNAYSISELEIYLFFAFAALIAASLRRFSRSAPVKPAVVLASDH